MRAYLIIVFQVRRQYVTEVPLAEHNNVVKALPSDRTDQPFGISILPRGAWRRWSVAKHRVLSFKAQLRLTPPPPGDRRRFAWRARPVRAPQRGPVPRVHRDAWGIGALRSGAV